VCGKVNFSNLSRYSDLSERTYRRQYGQSFAFVQLNQQVIVQALADSTNMIAAIDCSFIAKSGKATYGLDWFYNGSANRSEKGLEISVIAVIAVAAHQGYTLSVKQTPPTPVARGQQTRGKDKPTVASQAIEESREVLKRLPEPPKVRRTAQASVESTVQPALTRIDHYLEHLKATRRYFPSALKYLVGDGFYSKQKFVDGVVALQLHLISKLRIDANLRYLYNGPQKSKGRPRRYDGKVDLHDLSRLTLCCTLSPQLHLYTALVWHVSLKRPIRLAVLVDSHNPKKTGYVLLFSTDCTLDAKLMLDYYKARFQIEFIFRDAKQFTGLGDAQTRDPKKLDFHFNASLSALNLAKLDDQQRRTQTSTEPAAAPFSMASYKRAAFNDHLLQRFISQLDLDPTSIQSHPNYQNLRSYGIISI